MFSFFQNIIDFIVVGVQFVVNIITSIITLLLAVPSFLSYLFTIVAYIPSFLTVFVTFSVGLACIRLVLSLPSLFLFAFLPVRDHFPVNFPAKILFPPCLYFSPEPVSGLFQGPHPVLFLPVLFLHDSLHSPFFIAAFIYYFQLFLFKDPKFAEYIICDHIDNRSCQFTEHLINKPSVSPQFYHHNH